MRTRCGDSVSPRIDRAKEQQPPEPRRPPPPIHWEDVKREEPSRRTCWTEMPIERHEPGVRWPRDLLEVVTEEGSASSERRWSFGDNFPGPGSASFANAVESLWRASQRREDARQCAAELVDALSGALMAERSEHWGSRHPEEWALWYQLAWNEENNRRMTEIQIAMMRDPDVKRLERTGWLEVANRLEAALRESAGSSGDA